jgi:hypothetical protein
LSQPDVRVDAQAQVVALAMQAVGKAPAVRPALDEQEEEQAVTIVEALARITRLDGLDGLV